MPGKGSEKKPGLKRRALDPPNPTLGGEALKEVGEENLIEEIYNYLWKEDVPEINYIEEALIKRLNVNEFRLVLIGRMLEMEKRRRRE
jgi:hypothetical protein